MERTFIEKIACGELPSPLEIQEELEIMCDEMHSDCSDNCPVFRLGFPKFWINDSICECYMNGKKMYDYIREKNNVDFLRNNNLIV